MPLNLADHRDDEAVRSLLSDFSTATEFGRLLRQNLARRTLDEIAAAESDLVHEQQQLQSIEDRIAKIDAEHSLRMQYLMHFGVTPEERYEFQRLLNSSRQHGGMCPYEAAGLAHAQHRLKEDQRNGSTTGVESESIIAASVAV